MYRSTITFASFVIRLGRLVSVLTSHESIDTYPLDFWCMHMILSDMILLKHRIRPRKKEHLQIYRCRLTILHSNVIIWQGWSSFNIYSRFYNLTAIISIKYIYMQAKVWKRYLYPNATLWTFLYTWELVGKICSLKVMFRPNKLLAANSNITTI